MLTKKEINFQQRSLLENLKDYDMSALYYPGKFNVVVNEFSRMYIGSLVHIEYCKKELVKHIYILAQFSFG